MYLRKITVGFVVQEFDTEKRAWVSQEFVAGGDVIFESAKDCDFDFDFDLPFLMVQPKIIKD